MVRVSTYLQGPNQNLGQPLSSKTVAKLLDVRTNLRYALRLRSVLSMGLTSTMPLAKLSKSKGDDLSMDRREDALKGMLDETSQIPIETGIPIPAINKTSSQGSAGSRKYPVHRLVEVGMSFMIPHANLPASGITSVQTACNLSAKRHGFTITTRTVEDGIRVWRTA